MSSILQNPFLQEQWKLAIALYNDKVVPNSTNKNKVIAISAAVTFAIAYLIRDRLLQPPRKLRHIPYIGYFSVLKSLFTGESFWDRAYRVRIPRVESEGSKGLYLEPGGSGWEVHLSNPEDIKRVLLKHDLFPKASVSDSARGTLLGKFVGRDNIATLNGHDWKNQRKVANPAFHRSMPVKLFGKLTQEMFQLMETMGNIIDITDLMERWTLEAIGKAGFGFDFNAIRDKDNEWVNTYNLINVGVRDPFFSIFPTFDQELLWLFPKRKAIHKEMDRFLGMLDQVIQNKRTLLAKGQVQNDALEENEKDLLTLMIEHCGEGAMTDEDLKSNLCIFFLAGHDTTASALAFAIHYLAQHPEIQRKAREEAISILGDEPFDVLPTVEQTKQMIYINQIMKETLRINSPASRGAPRVATEDTELSGTFIPKGTLLNIEIFNVHHTEKYWKNSKEFNPDRFVENGEGVRGSGEGWSWIPFGNGARQCIGMKFSLNEQRVMLSMLLRKFTWKTPENSIHKDRVVTDGIQVISPHELDIAFQKRY